MSDFGQRLSAGLFSVYRRHARLLSPLKAAVLATPGMRRLARRIVSPGLQRLRPKSSDSVLPRFDSLADAINGIGTLTNLDAIFLFEEALLYCRETVQYDILKHVMEVFGRWAETRQNLNGRQLSAFLEIYLFGFQNLNGRVIQSMPALDIRLLTGTARLRAFYSYFYLLSSNLEYGRARAELAKIEGEMSPQQLYKVAKELERKPIRVEIDSSVRSALRDDIIQKLVDSLRRTQSPDEFVSLLEESLSGFQGTSPSLVASSLTSLKNRKLNDKETWTISSLLGSLFQAVLQKYGPATCGELLTTVRPIMLPSHADEIDLRIAAASNDVQALETWLVGEKATKARGFLGAIAWDNNEFDLALSHFSAMSMEGDSLGRRLQYLDTLQRLHFLSETSTWLKSSPSAAQPKGVVLLATLSCFNTLAMVTPALLELKRREYAIGSMMSGVISETPHPGLPQAVQSLFYNIKRSREDGEILLDWKVDWQAREVICDGVNYYQGIYERLSTIYRRASVSIDSEPVASTFASLLKRCDYVLRACRQVELSLADTDLPIVLLGSNSHVAPYSIIRDFCLAKRHPRLRYIICNVAYENYYSNLGGKLSRSMAVVDATLHPTCRAPFLAIRSRFEKWDAEFGRSEAVQLQFNKLLAADRSKAATTESEIGAEIMQAKAAGRHVVGCFGKILCDLSVPYDGGPAHQDMIDWINHSIDIALRHPDILLIVKPHPHELRPEIALELTETLRDICPEELPANVIFLDHGDFNLATLAPMIDTAVLWNGTSSLELTGLGVPVVMCAYFGRHDYPVDLIYPADRAHYESLLTSELPLPDESLRWRAMSLLHYMGTKDVAIPNEYSRRPITNDRIGIPSWDHEKMSHYVENGDPYMTMVVDRILEGVNAPFTP